MTRKPAVHQFVASLEARDAIGNHAMALRALLRKNGFSSEIFVWHASRSLRSECLMLDEYASRKAPGDTIIYHFSVGSPMTSLFLQAPGRKAIIYHNITPAEFFIGVSDLLYRVVKNGRRELRSIAGRVDLAIAVSEYNRLELVDAGFENTCTVPLLVDFGLYETEPDSEIISRYKDGGTNVIFVGRISPNKKQEDVIEAFAVYKKYIDSQSRLFIIGQNTQVPEYKAILDNLIEKLGVSDVHLTGGVSQERLNAYYSIADVFLCMSEHEGFCIPLIECMNFGVPVLAYDSSAIGTTLDGSGVLFREKDFGKVAGMIDELGTNEAFRTRIIERQKQRLEAFRPEIVEKQFMDALNGLLN